MADAKHVWIVVLDEVVKHVKQFVANNPMKYEGKELEAYTVGLGMVGVLCKKMIEDIKENK
tara:strand:+ start:1960 stop:2142 length:183 start_codon:yes stop_codon:yes gene_type:complete